MPIRGGGLPYKSVGDALRLALGCKLRVLVSPRVFGMESYYYIGPFRYRLVLCIQKFTKKCPDTDHTEISLRGQFKLEPPTFLSLRASSSLSYGSPPEVSIRCDPFLLTDKTHS